MKFEKPVIVEFWHQSCPTCKKIEPIVQGLPQKLGNRAKLLRFNVMESKEARRFAIDKGVIGTPTFKVYCKGIEKGEIVGLETTTNLLETIEKMIRECA
jgi:thiol-disulfide isomerase/thioredoxin